MTKFERLLAALPENCTIVITKFGENEGLDIDVTDPEIDKSCGSSLIKNAGEVPIELADISMGAKNRSVNSALKIARKRAVKKWGKDV